MRLVVEERDALGASGARALLAGLVARLRTRLRSAAEERRKGAARLFGLFAIGSCIALVIFGAAFAGGAFLRAKAALDLLRSGVSVLLLGVLAALVLSSLGHAANAFFTARDLWLWNASPSPTWARFFDRVLETALAALPATLALGALAIVGLLVGAGADRLTLLRGLVALALVAVVPVCLGVLLAHVGGALLPAGRLRRLSLLIVGVVIAGAMVAFRSFRLEQVVTEEGAARMLEGAKEVGTLGPWWLPSNLGAELVLTGSSGALALLASTSGAALLVAYLAHRFLYLRARDLADDEAPTGLSPGSTQERALLALVGLVPPDLRPVLEKDLLAFARDPSQWSQLVLLFGMAVVYVINAKALVAGFEPYPVAKDVFIGAFHVGLASFIAAGLAARFAFPQLGLEGPAVWIVEGSPLSPERVVRAKFLASLPVVAGFPTLVGVLGGLVIGLPVWQWALTTALIAAMACSLAAYGVGRGSVAPAFNAVSISELAMGPGALSTMAVAILLCGLAFLCTAASGILAYVAQGTAWAALALLPPLLPAGLGALGGRNALRRGAEAFFQRRVEGSAGTGAFPPAREAG